MTTAVESVEEINVVVQTDSRTPPSSEEITRLLSGLREVQGLRRTIDDCHITFPVASLKEETIRHLKEVLDGSEMPAAHGGYHWLEVQGEDWAYRQHDFETQGNV